MADVFIDRDGVINENLPDFVHGWSEFQFIPGSVEAIARLTKAGHRVVVITNQSAVSRGLLHPNDLEEIHHNLAVNIESNGGQITGFFVCPHADIDGCECRKPKPGLLFQAASELGIMLRSSFLVGDFVSDIEAARKAKSEPILVLTGRGLRAATQLLQDSHRDFHIALDLQHAVDMILDICGRRVESPSASLVSGGLGV